MVSIPLIHVSTWIATHLQTPRDGRLNWP